MFNQIPPSPGSPQNGGSFMAPAGGGGSAVLGAMNAPGMPVTTQQGNTAPVPMPQAPSVPTPPFRPTPMQNPMQNAAPVPPSVGLGSPQAQAIIKALTDQLKAHAEIEKHRAGIRPVVGGGPLT